MASFERLKIYLAQGQRDIEEDASRGILRFSPEQIEEGGRLLFDSLEQGGFAAFKVPGKSGWDPGSPYYEAMRKQARLGKNITRLFLIPHRHYLREERLRQHWELDTAAGIKCKFAIIGGPSQAFPLLPESLDFGIWDEQLVCWVYKQTTVTLNVAGQWVVTVRDVDLDFAKRIRDALLDQEMIQATPASALDEFALEEPLTKSAPLMASLSEFLCKGDHMDRESCGWYHKSWQYLRLLDLVSTPTWHSAFYLDALNEGVKRGKKQTVLISGAADYSMVAYALHAFKRLGVSPAMTLLDMCDTPLMISQWYASTHESSLSTVKQDILKFNPSHQFDCIVTDAFLTRFNYRDQRRVLKKWKSLLKRDGRIITTIRLDDSATPNGPVKPTGQEIDSFAERAKRLAELWRDFVDLGPEEIGRLAWEYGKRIASYSLQNGEELKKMFEEVGLQLDRCEEMNVKGEMKSSTYAEISASIA